MKISENKAKTKYIINEKVEIKKIKYNFLFLLLIHLDIQEQ